MPRLSCLLLLLLTGLAGTAHAGSQKVLLFGIDGLQAEALERLVPPHLEALRQRGVYSGQSWAPDHSLSGPGWATLFTGTERDRHGVQDNEFGGRDFIYAPHVLTLIERQKPGLVTAYAYNWGPLYQIFQPMADLQYSGPAGDDARLIDQAAIWLRQRDDLDVLSTYLYNLDETGHRHGFGADVPEYRDQLLRADAALGRLLAAIEARPQRARENWLILVVTDHGGSGTQHGENRPEHRRVPLILAADRLPPQSGAFLPLGLRQVDIVPTLLQHLGLPVHGLDGRPWQARPYLFRTGQNLLANPDARYGVPHTDPNYDPDIPGWHKGGRQTVMTAASLGVAPPRTSPLFTGLGTGSLTQRIPLPARAAGRPFHLQGWLGSSALAQHNLQLHLRFRGRLPRAALEDAQGASHFFRGDQVERFDYQSDRVSPDYLQRIADAWPGLERFTGGARDLDAAFSTGRDRAYFFKGNQVIRYDLQQKRADPDYPRPVTRSFPGLERFRGGPVPLDAALAINDQEACFFRGSQFIRYDLVQRRPLPGYPQEISALTWPGLEVWPQGIDAAVRRDQDTAYLFNGHEYLRFSLKRHSADNASPRPLDTSSWVGLQQFSQPFLGTALLTRAEQDGQLHLRQLQGHIPAGSDAAEIELRFIHNGSGGFPFATDLEFRVE